MTKKLSEMNLAFVDTETTGLSVEDHEIIEIAVLLYDQKEDKVIKEWETKIAPSHIETASEVALRINGYNDDPQSYTGSLKSAMIKFNSLVRRGDSLIVGQNVAFDLKFIYKSMERLNIEPQFDRRHLTLEGLSWWAVRNSNAENISLASVCSQFDVSNIGAHSALVDCRRTFEVYRKLDQLYKNIPNLMKKL